MRAVNPARGGGDIRWLAQNYTGRKIHTATKQDQLKIGFRQGLGRVPGARLVSPKGVPRWWRDAVERYGSDPVGGQLLVSACGFGRASASGALWRMAVGAVLFPGSPGGLPHPGLMVAYGCSSCQGGMAADFGAILGNWDWGRDLTPKGGIQGPARADKADGMGQGGCHGGAGGLQWRCLRG